MKKQILLTAAVLTTMMADQVILDDLIVDGSECIGFDCVDGETFGFDTLRVKENNMRIHFDDTSATADFPANDWRILINDSSNGGADYFSVEDSASGVRPFTLEAGAPANSLYVDDTGRIGVKTSTPVTELHLKDGDTSTLRLEQDGSNGWAPQAWDVAGNETNFFIRDVTNSSFLPFRIQPGTPSSTLTLNSTGNVGIGTWSPESTLDVRGNIIAKFTEADTANNHNLLAIDSNNTGSGASDVGFSMENKGTDFKWAFRTYEPSEGFAATKIGTGGTEFEVGNIGTTTGTTVVKMGGITVFENGHLVTASSRSLKTDIQPLDTQAALDAFHKLQPVSYAYKAHKDEAVVGFIAEDVPELVAMPSRKSIDSTEIVAVLTSVLAETRAEAKIKDAEMEVMKSEAKSMRAEISELKIMKQKVAMMESILTNLALTTSNTSKEKVSMK